MTEEDKKEHNQKVEKPKDIEKILIDLHPKFLEALRDVYPLAVLGSLCIAIAAFTTNTYPNAQVYAITAASLFLLAFVLSFAFKIFPNYLFAVLSYGSTGIAILFLFLVVKEFMKANSTVTKAIALLSFILFISIIVISATVIYRLLKKTESKIVRWCCLIVISLGIFNIFGFLVASLSLFVVFNASIFGIALYYSLLIFFILFLVIVLLVIKQRKRR